MDFRKKYAAELFSVLCSLTAGEAKIVVRGVIQKGSGFCSFTAICL